MPPTSHGDGDNNDGDGDADANNDADSDATLMGGISDPVGASQQDELPPVPLLLDYTDADVDETLAGLDLTDPSLSPLEGEAEAAESEVATDPELLYDAPEGHE